MEEKKGLRLISVTSKNINEFPPRCFMHTESEGYVKKRAWLQKQFPKGLKIKQLYPENMSKCLGFIEYVPGEQAWRAVNANGYLFIHCIWVYGNKNRNKGLGSLLINECVEDATKQKKKGVAVLASNGPFMAHKELFIKNGFKTVASCEPSFELMVKSIKRGRLPKFKSWQERLSEYSGLNIIYCNQCPWTARGIQGMVDIAKENRLKINVVELKSARQAQNAPSVYATFNLVYNRKLIADHYISHHRFRNIIKKEIKK